MTRKKRNSLLVVMVPCTKCGGEGGYELTGGYRDTLELLRKQKRDLNGKQLAKLARIKPTAMNNRLCWLEDVGLAEGKRNGKERLWKAV